MAETPYLAAWVPDDDPKRPWDVAADLAVEWILERARDERADPVLVVPDRNAERDGPEAIQWLARTHEAVTPRSPRPRRSGDGPVLAWLPDFKELDLAAGLARRSSLCAAETTAEPLIGWAMQRKALNLSNGEITPDTRPAALVEEFQHLEFVGNNAWADHYGKRDANRVLQQLHAAGQLDRDVVLGHMIAQGHHDVAVKRLGTYIDKIQGRR